NTSRNFSFHPAVAVPRPDRPSPKSVSKKPVWAHILHCREFDGLDPGPRCCTPCLCGQGRPASEAVLGAGLGAAKKARMSPKLWQPTPDRKPPPSASRPLKLNSEPSSTNLLEKENLRNMPEVFFLCSISRANGHLYRGRSTHFSGKKFKPVGLPKPVII